MTPQKRASYILFFASLVLVGWFGLGTLLVAVLFSYFALDQLTVLKRKWLTLLAFFVIVSIICVSLSYLIDQAIKQLPQAAMSAIPSIAKFAKEKNIELPFSDWDSLRGFALDTLKDELHYIGNFTRAISKQFIFILIGIVTAVSLFLNPTTDLDRGSYRIKNNLYSTFWLEFSDRFRSFFECFKGVMKAQLVIATINTGLTAAFITAVKLPYAFVAVALTFFCGLLPIVGNLISNTIIVCIGFTVSPQLGIGALIFLIVLHKLEYFLNSKIIGERIKNPVWLTLIALIVGERVMGITGMILAPVVLFYLKVEATKIRMPEPEEKNETVNR